jgi:predicted permease
VHWICLRFLRYSAQTMGGQILQILDVILPVFLVAAVGALFGRFVIDRIAATSVMRLPGVARADSRSIDVMSEGIRRSLHLFTFAVAGPALIFSKLHQTEINLELLAEPALIALVMYALLVAVSFGVAAVGRWEKAERRATVLAVASKNCANYGLPVVLYAFGEEGLVIGTLFMITHIVLHMTVGLSIAGWGEEGSWLKRLLGAFRFPYVYAVGLAFLLRAVDSSFMLPAAIARPILLGMELVRIRIAHVWRQASLLAAIKLILPPLLAFGLVSVFRIEGLVRNVLIVQSAMPTAVNGLLLSRQFNVRPDLVASVLMLSTLGSIATIAVLLGFLT